MEKKLLLFTSFLNSTRGSSSHPSPPFLPFFYSIFFPCNLTISPPRLLVLLLTSFLLFSWDETEEIYLMHREEGFFSCSCSCFFPFSFAFPLYVLLDFHFPAFSHQSLSPSWSIDDLFSSSPSFSLSCFSASFRLLAALGILWPKYTIL